MGSCRCVGDPHCWTFDNKRFDFQGRCRYTYVRDNCQNGFPVEGKEPTFTVTGNHYFWKKQARQNAWIKELGISIGGQFIELTKDATLIVDGVLVKRLPISINQTITIEPVGTGKIKFFDSATLLTVYMESNKHRTDIRIPDILKRQVCGLCGDWDGKQSNDWVVGPDTRCGSTRKRVPGDTSRSIWSWGHSWTHSISADPPQCAKECLTEDPVETPPCATDADKASATAACEDAIKGERFQACLEKMDPAEVADYMDNCIYDTCVMAVQEEAICPIAEEFAQTCREYFNFDAAWRSDDFCPLECPANQRYSICGNPCQPTCSDPENARECKADMQCLEGCFCDVGFVWDGEACIKPAQCGCQKDGMWFQEGDSYIDGTCKKQCTCSDGAVTCVPSPACNRDAECGVTDGIRGCQCKPGFLGDGIQICAVDPNYPPPAPISELPDPRPNIVTENDCPAKQIIACLTCYNANSEQECAKNGVFEECTGTDTVCESVKEVLPNGDMRINRQCSARSDCEAKLPAQAGMGTDYKCQLNGDQYLCKQCVLGVRGEDYQCQNKKAVKKGKCYCNGDPHCYSYAGKKWNFQGRCSYVYTRDKCEGGLPISGETPTFMVVGNHYQYRKSGPYVRNSWLQNVDIYIGEYKVGMNLKNEVFVNDVKVNKLPADVSATIRIGNSGKYKRMIDEGTGVEVFWGGGKSKGFKIDIRVPETLKGQICGMCGDFGKQDWVIGDSDLCADEGFPAPGSTTKDTWSFGKSWTYALTPDQPRCLENCFTAVNPDPDPCANEQDRTLAEAACNEAILSATFKPCTDQMPAEELAMYVDDCVFDTCSLIVPNADSDETTCPIANGLAEECLLNYNFTDAWRTPDFCPLECEEGQEYAPCGPACPATCSDPSGVDDCEMAETCMEGCVCKEGTIWDGTKCIAPEDCGCRDNGIWYSLGDTWTTDDCTQTCSCAPGDNIECNANPRCHDNAVCGVSEDGVRGCQCDEGYVGDGITNCKIDTTEPEPETMTLTDTREDVELSSTCATADGEGLACLTCIWAGSENSCRKKGEMQTCASGQDICISERYILGNGKTRITRMCGRKLDCLVNAGVEAGEALGDDIRCTKEGKDWTCRQCVAGVEGEDYTCPVKPETLPENPCDLAQDEILSCLTCTDVAKGKECREDGEFRFCDGDRDEAICGVQTGYSGGRPVISKGCVKRSQCHANADSSKCEADSRQCWSCDYGKAGVKHKCIDETDAISEASGNLPPVCEADEALYCWSCDAASESECYDTGAWEQCANSNSVCFNVAALTDSNDITGVQKGCAARETCKYNQLGEYTSQCEQEDESWNCKVCNYGGAGTDHHCGENPPIVPTDPSTGCSMDGQNYTVGEEFLSVDCSEYCTCAAHSLMVCKPTECNGDATCAPTGDKYGDCICNEGLIGDGLQSCEPEPTTKKITTPAAETTQAPTTQAAEETEAAVEEEEETEAAVEEEEEIEVAEEEDTGQVGDCTCTVRGDPLVTTYDGQPIVLLGQNKYTLTKANNQGNCYFNVAIKAGSATDKFLGLTYARFVDVDVFGTGYKINQNNTVRSGGSFLDLPAIASDPDTGNEVAITQEGEFVQIKTSCGFTLRFNGDGTSTLVEVTVPKSKFAGRMDGLCGECDGKEANDLKTDEGLNVAQDPAKFVLISDSFVVDEAGPK